MFWTDQGWVLLDSGNAGDVQALNDFPFFHRNGWNVLYLDGHVKWISTDMAKPMLQSMHKSGPYAGQLFSVLIQYIYNKLY
jgi:prepilin-type processing-associated H-X9-DG protein